jgi:hypothetical protein
LKDLPFLLGIKSIKADGILPNMGMDLEHDGPAGLGQFIEGAQRDNDAVARAVNIHHALGNRFLNENSAESGNHAVLAISRQSHVWGTISEKAPEARRAWSDRLTVTGNKPVPSLSRGRRKRNAAYGLFT